MSPASAASATLLSEIEGKSDGNRDKQTERERNSWVGWDMRIYHSNTNTTTTSDPSVSPSVCLSITSTFSTVSFFCLSSIALSSAPCNPECCAIPAGSTGSHRHEPSYRGGKSVPPHHQPPQNYHRIKQCFMCYFSAMVMTAWWKINIGKWTFWSFTKMYTMVAQGRSAPSVAGFINKWLFWTSYFWVKITKRSPFTNK